MDKPDLLQICPYDTPPFREILRAHSAAAALLGWRTQTVFLHSPDARVDASPEVGDRFYMEGPDDPAGIHHLRRQQPQKLVLYHRYRSFRVARRAGLRAPHEALVAHEFGMLGSAWRRLRLRLQARGLRLVGVSPPVARHMNTRWLLPNGLIPHEQDRWRVARHTARAHLGVGQQELVIGVLGRLHGKKNLELALRGFADFLSSYDADARLLFIGDGPRRVPLQRAIQERGLQDRVRLAGFVPNANRYLKALDVLLFPATRVEAFGMGALEAMLAEVPVVAGPAEGPAWVLGERAHYFADYEAELIGAALLDAVRSPITGRERALQEFTPERLAGYLESLVQG
ncbi:MAG: glycosyltransferase [Pseudomonadota bacterium]